MADRPAVSLRLEPHMLSELAAAYGRAVVKVGALVQEVWDRGRMPRPWTDDDVSQHVTDVYHQRAMGQTDSAYAALRLYLQELTAVRDTLRQMEADYRSTEGDNAELWGRL